MQAQPIVVNVASHALAQAQVRVAVQGEPVAGWLKLQMGP